MSRNTAGLKRGGSPGRRPGVPNKATVEARIACSELVDDPEYRRSLAKRLRAGKLSPAVEIMLWYYSKGKPRESVEQQGTIVLRWQDDLEPRLKAARKRSVASTTDKASGEEVGS